MLAPRPTFSAHVVSATSWLLDVRWWPNSKRDSAYEQCRDNKRGAPPTELRVTVLRHSSSHPRCRFRAVRYRSTVRRRPSGMETRPHRGMRLTHTDGAAALQCLLRAPAPGDRQPHGLQVKTLERKRTPALPQRATFSGLLTPAGNWPPARSHVRTPFAQ